jgi:glycosyltransferase involved in cell wall biosynthesis
VHVHLSVVSAFATLLARDAVRAGLPVVVTVHSLWRGRITGVRAVGDIVGWGRWPVLWTAVSTAAAVDMQRVLPPATWVSIVPNAVDVAWWREDIEPPAVRRPGEPVRVLSVMRLAPRKRPLQLVKTLRKVRAAVPADQPIEVTVVGDGPLLGRLQTELRRRGMQDWVHLPGRLSRTEIRDLCRSSDLYVAPAHRESFGIAALEARAAGLPVLAMRSGGVGEFIEEGVEGTLCRDDAAMRRALTELVVDHEKRREMARHSAGVAPSLDWATVLERVEQVYARASSYAVPRLTVSEDTSAVDQDISYVRR